LRGSYEALRIFLSAKMKNLMVLSILSLVIIITGCSLFYDYYPATVSKDALGYVGKDPNSLGWQCVAKAKEVREEVLTKHVTAQLDYQHLISKDSALYDRAIEQTNINIQRAEAERAKVIGTIEQPGWLLGLLLPVIGGLGGRFLTTLTHYSEQEYQAGIAKAKSA
jgi:hypothetical protein